MNDKGGFMMKRFSKMLTTVLVLLFVCSNALAEEIRFRGIPWFSSIDETFAEIGIFDKETTKITAENRDFLFTCWSNRMEGFGYHILDDVESYDNAGFRFNPISTYPIDDVAGYHLTYLELQFMYGVTDTVYADKEHAQFISGKYTLHPDSYPDAYDDLRDKLIWLYGEPISEKSESSEWNAKKRISYTRWDGDNGTSILLYTQYMIDGNDTISSSELTIEYYKTDVTEKLEYIEQYWVERERDEKYNSENTNGL